MDEIRYWVSKDNTCKHLKLEMKLRKDNDILQTETQPLKYTQDKVDEKENTLKYKR